MSSYEIYVGKPGLTTLAFSPDGRLLAHGGLDPTLTVWNVATAELWLRAA